MHGAGGARRRLRSRQGTCGSRSPLAGVGVDGEVVVVEQCVLVIAAPAVEKVAVPGSLILPLSGVAGQCEMPPVPTIAMRSGTASAARRKASPKAQARGSGVSGGPDS